MGGPLGAAAAAAAGQLGQLGQHTYVVTKGELDPPSWQHRLYHNIFLQTKKVYHNSNNYWQHQNSAETYPKTLTMNIKKTNQGQVRGGAHLRIHRQHCGRPSHTHCAADFMFVVGLHPSALMTMFLEGCHILLVSGK